MNETLRKHLHGSVKQIDRSKREVMALLTHQVVDADGEVVMAGGVDWSRFRHNAPMLYQHDRERKVGNWDATSLRLVTVEGAPGWMATGKLFSTGPLVDQVYRELQEGDMGVSIGFRAKQADFDPVAPGQTGRTFRSVEIIEASLVTLQSCPTCTIREKSARRACGQEMVLELVENDERVLLLEDDTDAKALFMVEEADVRSACETVLRRQIDAAVRRQVTALGLFGVAESPVLVLEQNDGELRTIDPGMLTGALTAVLERTIARETRAALNRLTGRVD